MKPKEELAHLLTQDGKYKWKLDPNMAKYQNLIFNDEVAERAFYNTVYEVAVLGKWKSPPDFIGKPEGGWRFKTKSKWPVMHSHPSLNLYVDMNPNNALQPDRMSIVWRRVGGTIIFDVWKHSEYNEKLRNI